NNIASVQYIRGDTKGAIINFERGLAIARDLEDRSQIATFLTNLSLLNKTIGNIPEALECHRESIANFEELGDTSSLCTVLVNLGVLYKELKDFKNAKKQYDRAQELYMLAGDRKGLSHVYIAQGAIETMLKNYAESMRINRIALAIKIEVDDHYGEALALSNMGQIKLVTGNLDSAIFYFERSMNSYPAQTNSRTYTSLYTNLGTTYYRKGNYKKARHYAELASELLEANNNVGIAYKTYHLMANIEKQAKNWQTAYKFKALELTLYDSIKNQDNVRAMAENEFEYTYGKKRFADSLIRQEEQKTAELIISKEKAETKQHKLEAEQRQQQIYFLFGGLGITLVFGVFIFSRFRIAKRQKAIIVTQKRQVDLAYDQLEERNTEITDSIVYAKRIQSAILPPAKMVKEYLPDSFILYKPKDVVAGDFYWLEQQDGKILFAAADCTGHGVPGAMVSVICNNGLNRSVREYGLTDPGEILDKTKEVVIQEFEKSEEEVRDGMDIAICVLEGNTLKYAGANNPLWIIRNGEILETKADKQPIGKYAELEPFTTRTIALLKGDIIYVFSDGYVDQFGGDKGKKFKPSNFRKLLLSFQDQTMEDQKSLLDEAFETWRGAIEQVDDVCVIGVRI
ncbi:MAG: serine phosphatase RsbU (regulator of sigma subunit), partial [Nonlabens sp.]